MRYKLFIYIMLSVFALIAACGEDEKTPTEPENGGPYRDFALGFTDFPHAGTEEAYLAVWDVLANDADMAVLHFDGGVPWPEALAETRYNDAFMSEISFKESRTRFGFVVYVAVTPISFARDALALYRGAEPNLLLPSPWDTLSFDDSDVIKAFINHCSYMIDTFDPDYFAYAIEANMLIALAPEKWDAFVVLAEQVYESLKASYPDLPVFITLHTETYHADKAKQEAGIADILPYSDLIALSSYGYAAYPDPADLPVDYFSALHDLSPGKGFAISETAWPAEDVTALYPAVIPADTLRQQAYVERLLYDADSLDAAFVSWFFSRDFDEYWEDEFQYLPNAALIRFWKDTGLYDGDGNARPALDIWRAALAVPLKQ